MKATTLRSTLLGLAPAFVLCAPFLLDSGGAQDPSAPASTKAEESGTLEIGYLEIVTPDRDATCDLLEKLHGVTFGDPVEALGNARTTKLAGGGSLGVRAPMHGAEESVVRPYFLVDDIEAGVEQATASDGELMVPPMATIDDGEFAIYMHGGIQYGLWKN